MSGHASHYNLVKNSIALYAQHTNPHEVMRIGVGQHGVGQHGVGLECRMV